MRKLEPIASGTIYGRMTVVELMEDKYRGKEFQYLCLCSCGKHKAVTGTALRKGSVVSCGCAKSDRPRKTRVLKAGEIFGRLTILENPEAVSLKSIYACICSCGNRCDIKGSLIADGTKSCGCLMRETTGNSFRIHGLSKTKAYKAAAQMARAARKIRATPSWADMAKIGAIYVECNRRREAGEDVQVDHEVPLKGKKVCGLHVHYNLRIIPTFDNRSKSNRFDDEVVAHLRMTKVKENGTDEGSS